MARRTQLYLKANWNGGLNDSVDPGVLPDNDLVIADNVIFATSGSRLKREGIDYFDNIDLPAVTSVTRSGTTVTITFADNVDSVSNKILFAGEKVTVVTSDSQFNVTATALDSVSTNTATYTVGVTPTAASATFVSLTRTATIVGGQDFWYYDASNNAKSQVLLAVNSDAQFFKYDTNGNRLVLTNKTYSVTFTDAGDTVTIAAHGLVEGDAILFTSITSTTGISANTVYYVGGTITTDTFQVTATKGGSTLTLTTDGSGTAVSPLGTSPITSADFLVINERCLITFDGIKNFPKMYEPQTSTTTVRGVFGAPPNASIMRKHQGRVWMNSKSEPDRLYYSSPFNPEEWSGYGDSGVLDISVGDGDPEGIVAIDPTFKGALFVKKRAKTYRIDGLSPESYSINEVTSSLGATSHKATSQVDLDDSMYVSYKGIHSLAATSSYGDFEGAFLSGKIQNAFKDFTAGRLKYAASQYVPSLNSVFFALSTGETSQTQNDALYIYNTKFKEWHRWPEIEAACLMLRSNDAQDQLLFGDYNGRINKCQIGEYSDYETDSIIYRIKTGTIYVDNNPVSVKAFKRIGFLFKPKGQYTFTVKAKIDNAQPQSLAFTQSVSGAQLGVDFILGTSVLAFDSNLAPYMLPIDGYGRGITITIEQTGLDEQVEIYGMIIEYELADIAQETVANPSTDPNA